MKSLKNQPHPSAIDTIARWYGRTKAVERIAKDYRKRSVTGDFSDDFRALHKDAKALSASVWRLGMVQDMLARETISHVRLPMKEVHQEVLVLEARLGVLLTDIVYEPTHYRQVKKEEALMWAREEREVTVVLAQPQHCYECHYGVRKDLHGDLQLRRIGGHDPQGRVYCTRCWERSQWVLHHDDNLAPTP